MSGYSAVMLATVLAVISATGRTTAWVSQSPLVLGVTSVVLGVVGVVTLVAAPHGCECGCAGGPPHRHSVRGGWGVIVTVVLAGLISPPALGAAQVTDATWLAAHSGRPADYPPITATTDMGVWEFIGRSSQPADHRLDNQAAMLRGRLAQTAKGWVLEQVVMYCCAADARAYRIRLDDPEGLVGELSTGDPVAVEAGFHPGSAVEETDFVPLATVKGLERDDDLAPYELARQ